MFGLYRVKWDITGLDRVTDSRLSGLSALKGERQLVTSLIIRVGTIGLHALT